MESNEHNSIDEIALTAYALGELDGASRQAVAARLARDPRARKYVAELRETTGILSDALARESMDGLDDARLAAIEKKLSGARPNLTAQRQVFPRAAGRWDKTLWAMSLAASVAIVGGVLSLLIPILYRHSATKGDERAQVHPEIVPFHGPGSSPDHPSPPGKGTPPIRPGEFADNGGPDALPSWTPPPDARLVWRPDDEAPARETPLVGAHQPDNAIAPAPRVRVAEHPAENAPGDSPAPDNHHAIAIEPIPPKKHDYADLPPDQPAPGRSPGRDESAGGANTRLANNDAYAHVIENPYIDVAKQPLSGFSAGVDTASYANIRRYLMHGKLPPSDAVRIEEMLNYFPVRAGPAKPGQGPLLLSTEAAACPWNPRHRLARICLAARALPPDERPAANLVFAIDISKSMQAEKTRLPMLKQAILAMTARLSHRDSVGIVAYGFEAGIVLAPTPADNRSAIRAALDRLEKGGATDGGQGIETIYRLARSAYIPAGTNRVILATDGNWIVGAADPTRLENVIAQGARDGVSLTVLGIGMENLKDATMQRLAAAGNGSYGYIDTAAEARKLLADQVNGAMIAVARDAKIGVRFDARAAEAYRLIGYERRILPPGALTSVSKSGGEIGAGQSVTALYEIIPTTAPRPIELLSTTVTYVDPATGAARTIESTCRDTALPFPSATGEFRFAAAVAEAGLLLRDSDYKGASSFSGALNLARNADVPDPTGYRRQFIELLQRAQSLERSRNAHGSH